jgi:hypothetical protein
VPRIVRISNIASFVHATTIFIGAGVNIYDLFPSAICRSTVLYAGTTQRPPHSSYRIGFPVSSP